MEQEQWKPIQEFNGEYEVSNLGRVRSMKRYYGMKGTTEWLGASCLRPSSAKATMP